MKKLLTTLGVLGAAHVAFAQGVAPQAAGEAAVKTPKPAAEATVNTPKLESDGLWGYITMDVPPAPKEFAYGVSLYANAWPLLAHPLSDFQIGLCSIWLMPDNRKVDYSLLPTGTVARDSWPERGPSYRDVFQTIEGGLGFWGSTHFGSTTAKFRMNGTPDGYNHEISSPGWGFGSTTALPENAAGIAQLSSHLLVPPDGITFRAETTGKLFGYAWMALPLIAAKSTTAGLPVTTGDQSWTLFINTKNFKGPVAFYTPATWSRISRRYPPAIGRGLDARPGLVTGGAIEINTVPRLISQDDKGTVYTRIPTLQFPVDAQNRTVLLHNMTFYSKGALWDQVQRWMQGGAAASGTFDTAASVTPQVEAKPLVVKQDKVLIQGTDRWVETRTFDDGTFGLQWQDAALDPWPGQKNVRRGQFPAYFRRDGDTLTALMPNEVPTDTGLQAAQFHAARTDEAYTSPDDPTSFWKQPGPKAGPFQAKLTDGSVVTYYWYRFIDQPALQDADLSDAEKARLQQTVEKMQRAWTSKKDYLPPPTTGALATLDEALIVTPPKGLEIGYVPIATRQAEK